GSYRCRAGWASKDDPLLIFRNVTFKQKNKKTLENEILVGNDIINFDQVYNHSRSAFERNVVTQFDIQEQIFDYIFRHLQINSVDSDMPHPLVITEPLSNPNYSRERMSELLFEHYSVPSVQYGVDSLFGLYFNNTATNEFTSDHFIISCGYKTSHLIPIVRGRMMKCRRFNYGGNTIFHINSYSLLHLKYPGHIANITPSRAEHIVQNKCHFAIDFNEKLLKWTNDSYYNKHVIKYQLPFNQVYVVAQKISTEQLKQRHDEQIKRLMGMNLKRRQEKLISEQEKLSHYISLMDIIREEVEENGEYDNDAAILQDNNFSGMQELRAVISKLNNSIEALQDKIMTCTEQVGWLFIHLLFLNATGSMPPLSDTDGRRRWLDQLKADRQRVIDRMNERKNWRNEMMRRRTMASHRRISLISELAKNSKNTDDNFGINDEDWNIYKEINKDSRNSDSENDLDQLEEMEICLQEYDPEFRKIDPSESADLNEYYQIHVALEQIRIPELVYQPSMMGSEQAGLCEGIGHVLRQFNNEQQLRLVQDIFVIGGYASIPNFKSRLEKELLEIRPFESKFKVRMAANPVLDAWKGARLWSINSENLRRYSTNRKDYYEFGGDYLKTCCISNRTSNDFLKNQML
ncbi:hypothetical protein HELRODRAFT_70073, partial [Helobdella robusta]|uniref:Uncharacterized protein n=1 Tax=Helobdella robusta TaxID=6412 RepID=T1G023_HELRO